MKPVSTSRLAPDSFLTRLKYFIIIPCLLLLYACFDSGSDSGDDKPNPGASAEESTVKAPDFGAAVLQSQSSRVIDADLGGTVEHDGARLIIPPDCLDESATITLATTTLPSQALPDDDGALLGRKALSDRGFVIMSDKDLSLSEPLVLHLPVNPDLIPGGTPLSDIELSTDIGGFLIPQGSVDEVNLAEGYVAITLDPDLLSAQSNNQLIGYPQALSTPFLVIVGLLATTPLTLNPIIATLDDINLLRFTTRRTTHFTVHYRADLMSEGQVSILLGYLERSYLFFVEELGFALPNRWNGDDRYTVVFDDLNEHVLLKVVKGGDIPDGFTLPGSSLFEGASYVNILQPADEVITTAIHEYFHAVQYGALTNIFTANFANKKLNSQSQWLFEGSANIMSGRIFYGSVTNASRDTSLQHRLKPGLSLFEPSQDSADPAEDVAQDFFFFIEKQLGNIDFYRPAFASIAPNPLDSRERAVRALDEVLKQLTSGTWDMSTGWKAFVPDYLIDNPSQYATLKIAESVILNPNGSRFSTSIYLPPLSYWVLEIGIPKLEKDSNGIILPNQLKELEIETSLSSSGGSVNIELVDTLSPDHSLRESVADASIPKTHSYPGYRGEGRKNLFVVISNSAVGTTVDATLNVSARLVGGSGDIEILAIENLGDTLNTSPTSADIVAADIQLSGDAIRPTISWSFSDAVAVAVQGGSSITDTSKYGIQGIFVEDVPGTGQGHLETITSPVTYGDYTIPKTKRIDGMPETAPDLMADFLEVYVITILTETNRASISFRISD